MKVHVSCSPVGLNSRAKVFVFTIEGWTRGVVISRYRHEWELLADGLDEVTGTWREAKVRMISFLEGQYSR